MIGLIRELLSAARDGYLDARQGHAPDAEGSGVAGPGQPGKNRGERAGLVGRESSHFPAVAPPGTAPFTSSHDEREGRRVEQADDSWFAPAIPVLPPTGGVRVRRARPDEQGGAV